MITRKIHYVIMVLVIILSTASVLSTHASDNVAIRAHHQGHEWSLPPLSRDERIEILRKYIQPYSYDLYAGTAITTEYSDEDRKECNLALGKIRGATAQSVLVPAHVVQSADDTVVHKILGKCAGTIEPDKDYKPSKKVWEDEKTSDHGYSYYFQATANMEFYDLEAQLGQGFWGYFAEGGRPHCKSPDNEACETMVGYAGIAKIFDARTCKEVDNLGIPVSRLRPQTRSSRDGLQVTFKETNSFFAFVTSGDDLYQVSLSTGSAPHPSCDEKACPHEIGENVLYISRIESSSNSKKLHCVFKGTAS